MTSPITTRWPASSGAAVADPDGEVRYVTDADMAEGCCLCRDYGCTCEVVRSVTLTEEDEWRLWFWIVGGEGRYLC